MDFDMNPTVFWTGVVVSGILSILIKPTKKRHPISKAVAFFEFSGVKGHVYMDSVGKGNTQFTCDLTNLTPGYHGMHVHKHGTMSNECKSVCEHYNPENRDHGGPLGQNRHKGDIGNIYVDATGASKTIVIANVSVDEIIGRSLVIHADEDDLGMGSADNSHTTGNSGEKIGCATIGISNHDLI